MRCPYGGKATGENVQELMDLFAQILTEANLRNGSRLSDMSEKSGTHSRWVCSHLGTLRHRRLATPSREEPRI